YEYLFVALDPFLPSHTSTRAIEWLVLSGSGAAIKLTLQSPPNTRLNVEPPLSSPLSVMRGVSPCLNTNDVPSNLQVLPCPSCSVMTPFLLRSSTKFVAVPLRFVRLSNNCVPSLSSFMRCATACWAPSLANSLATSSLTVLLTFQIVAPQVSSTPTITAQVV